MDKEALTTSLLAGYEAANYPVPYEDEDFEESKEGDWVRLEGGWVHVMMQKLLLGTIYLGFRAPKEDLERYREACEELDQMTQYKLITTLDQRRLRYARKRAEELCEVTNKNN